ncbi:MAG TPA: class I SAM-dependent methyltransferase [Acidobacteriota bacterium]
MTPCPLCGGATAAAFEKGGFCFRSCGSCEHLFLHPPPTAEQEARYYERPEIHNHYLYHYYRSWHRRRARQDLKFIARFQPPGRLLDVGCSFGFFLEAARAAGWQPVGLETAPLPADYARRSGLEVHSSGIETAPLESECFDLVSFLDSFEHHVAPRPALAAAARWLKPGGRIYLKLPNRASWTYLLAGPAWSAIFGPGHPHYYAPDSLRRLLEQAGFAVEHLSSNSSEPHWQYFVIEAALLRARERWLKRGWIGPVALFDKLYSNLDVLAAFYFATRPLYYLMWPFELRLDRRLLGHQIVAVARKA